MMCNEIDKYEKVIEDIKEKQSKGPNFNVLVICFRDLEENLITITNDLVLIESKIMGPTVPIEVITEEKKGDDVSGYLGQFESIRAAMYSSITNISNQIERLKQVLVER